MVPDEGLRKGGDTHWAPSVHQILWNSVFHSRADEPGRAPYPYCNVTDELRPEKRLQSERQGLDENLCLSGLLSLALPALSEARERSRPTLPPSTPLP